MEIQQQVGKTETYVSLFYGIKLSNVLQSNHIDSLNHRAKLHTLWFYTVGGRDMHSIFLADIENLERTLKIRNGSFQ